MENDFCDEPPIPMGPRLLVCSKCHNERKNDVYGTLCEDCFAEKDVHTPRAYYTPRK
jgi:hypothetical protein